jgi:hypothetical protein
MSSIISFTTFLVLKVIVTAYGSALHSEGIARGVMRVPEVSGL